MIQNTIYTRATNFALRQIFEKIPKAALGEHGYKVAADTMMTRIGLAILARIKKAFITKARGGTDEAGEKWKPLSPKTIAYSRRHPGLPKSSKRAGYAPSYALSVKQRDRWWEVYRQQLARFKGDKSQAARNTWAILKREGATTLLSKYGNTQVEILRDIGLLLNSLSPGVASAEQIFRIGRGEVIVGTNRKGAIYHHKGIPGRLPQRKLWPDPKDWPSEWWDDILEQARATMIDIVTQLVRGSTP